MKYMVAYWSQTGNTKKVAEAIFAALPEEKTLKPLAEVENLDGFDVIFIGFPIMQFGPPPSVKKFLAANTQKKTIALFVTHAMLSQSGDAQQQAMLVKELDKCAAVCSGSNLLGLFHCQGELSENAANDLIASNIPILMEFAELRRFTLGHPNAGELAHAQNFARAVTAT